MTHGARRLLLALAALAAACAHPEPRTRYDLPVELRDDWVTAPSAAADVDPDWWRAFGEAPLAALVAEAQGSNPDLAVLAARLRAEQARADVIGADRLPSASLGFSRAREKRVFIGLPVPGTETVATRATTYSLSLDTSWEVDLWGRLAAAESAARAQALAAGADLAGARLSLVGAVVSGWIALLEAELQVGVAERGLGNWRSNRQLVERRYRAGLRSAVDLRIIAASEAAARARLADRLRDRAEAARSLELLLGRYPAAELAAARALPELPGLAPAGLPVDLLARRPDLFAAEQRLAAAELGVAVARAAFYPSLVLTGSVGTTSDDVGDMLDGDFSVWSLVYRLAQPIYQGGRLVAQVELADAAAAEAFALFTGTLLGALAEVESALEAERRLAAREEALDVAAREALAARNLAADRYGSGLGDVVTLLETERGAQDAESALLTARRARLDARIDLHLALGGGFGTAWTTDPLVSDLVPPGASEAPAAHDPGRANAADSAADGGDGGDDAQGNDDASGGASGDGGAHRDDGEDDA